MSRSINPVLRRNDKSLESTLTLSNESFGWNPMAWLSKHANSVSGNDSGLPSRRWVVVVAVACVIAIAASSYLGWVALTSSKIAGCGGGKLFNCGHVISSRWSLWMGIPVSLLAVGLYIGVGLSLFVGACTSFSRSVRYLGWALVSMLAMSAGLAAIWFISLQVFVLNHLCTYCLVAHACGLVIASVVLFKRPIGVSALKAVSIASIAGFVVLIGGQLLTEAPKTYKIETFETPATESIEVFEFEAPFAAPAEATEPAAKTESDSAAASLDRLKSQIPTMQTLKRSMASLLSPANLLTSQVQQSQIQQDGSPSQPSQASNQQQAVQGSTPQNPGAAKPVVAKAPAERRMVSINGGTVKLDVAQWPLAGSPSAKYIFVEMFDYSCPHCRHTHTAIKGASEKLNGNMAVVVLPIPLNSTCNNAIQVTDQKFAESCQIAQLAVAVWRVDSVKFTDFHNWMFATEPAPTYAMAKAYADSLVDTEKLNAEIASQVPSQYISKMVELYKRAGSGNVPKLIFPGTTIVGEFTSTDSLVDVIKQQIK